MGGDGYAHLVLMYRILIADNESMRTRRINGEFESLTFAQVVVTVVIQFLSSVVPLAEMTRFTPFFL